MSLFIRLTLAAVAVLSLASCGGGSAEPPPPPTSGKVVEGYLSGATVLCDVNGNGVADSGEITVKTDSGGNFTFPTPGCTAGMTAVGGRDVDTGIDFKGVLRAPAGATMITPLTTLMVAGMTQERVIAALGLAAGTDIANADPVLDPALMKKSLAIEQLLIKTTEMFAGLGSDSSDATMQAVYSEVVAAYAILLQGGGTLIAGTAGTEMDSILVAQLVKVATQRVAQSQSVGSKVKTALAELNAESLGIATSGGLTVQAEHILNAAKDAIIPAATASQSDTTITEIVTANKSLLKSAPSSATYELGAVVTEEVTNGLATAPVVPATLPITFDGSTPVPFLGFNGAEGSSIEAGPSGGNGKSLRILRSGGETYAGAFITTERIAFAADKKTFTARVYSPKAGIRMILKVEGDNGLSSADFDATTAVVVGWQTLTWVATGVDPGKSYTKITLLPNLGVIDPAPGQSYYFDDIALVNDISGAGGATLPISFDEATPVPFTGFDGAEGTTIEAGPAGGGTGKSLKILRSGGKEYAGAYITTAPIPVAADKKTFTARVHSPKAGIPIFLKLEAGEVKSADFPATTPVVAGWQTLTWVATGLDLIKSYTRITLLPNLGTVDAAPGQPYYFDDITLVKDGTGGTGPTDYLALVADTISLVNGGSKADYTMAQFESDAGIGVGWPIPSPTLMRVTLKEVGNVTLPAGLKVTAAVSITETVAGGKGEIQAYIADVAVTKTAAGLEILVPTTSADSLAYSVSTDEKKKMVIDFAGGVKGVNATLTTAANMTNSLKFGEVVQYAINSISGQGFTGIYGLRGKYRVTVVLTGLPVRRSDGSALPNAAVVVPTRLGPGGVVEASKTVTGPGLVGFVNLTD